MRYTSLFRRGEPRRIGSRERPAPPVDDEGVESVREPSLPLRLRTSRHTASRPKMRRLLGRATWPAATVSTEARICLAPLKLAAPFFDPFDVTGVQREVGTNTACDVGSGQRAQRRLQISVLHIYDPDAACRWMPPALAGYLVTHRVPPRSEAPVERRRSMARGRIVRLPADDSESEGLGSVHSGLRGESVDHEAAQEAAPRGAASSSGDSAGDSGVYDGCS